MSPEAQIKVKKVFESNPQLTQVIVTSDGQCFTHGNIAANHAGSLKDTSMVTVHRSQVLTVVVGENTQPQDETPPAPPKTGGEQKKEYSAAAEKELIGQIEAAETVEAVEALIAGITWKKVLKAAA